MIDMCVAIGNDFLPPRKKTRIMLDYYGRQGSERKARQHLPESSVLRSESSWGKTERGEAVVATNRFIEVFQWLQKWSMFLVG